MSIAHFAVAGTILLAAALAPSNAGAADIPPNAWTPMRATGDGPDYGGLTGRRGWIQVAYDPASKTVLMFGGDANTYLSDVWQAN